MNKRKFKIIILFVLCVLLFSGCTLTLKKKAPADNTKNQTGQTDTQNTNLSITEKLAAQSKIKKFSSYADLKDFLENKATSGGTYGFGGGIARSDMMLEKSVTAMPSTATADFGLDSATNIGLPSAVVTNETTQTNTSDYSKTNVQVAGVDEADIIKTDGQYVYAVAKNSLFIIKAVPADQAEIVSKIEFKDRPSDIYISGDSLVIYGNDQEMIYRDYYKGFRRQNSYVFLKIFDITDRKNPKQIRDLDFEGSYSDSRLIGDNLYFITNNYNYYYQPEEPILPRIVEGGTVLPNECQVGTKCFTPSVYYFDIPYDNYNFTTITAINIKDASNALNGEVYMLASGQNFYVSQNNIYLTYTKYLSEYDLMIAVLKEMVLPKLSAKDQERIKQVEATDDFILNQSEKMTKVAMIIERYRVSLTDSEQKQLEEELKTKMKQKYEDISKELEKTVIHKIAINQGKVEYKTVGEVTGSVLNQFSMDEDKGFFRIATTKSSTWSQFAEGSANESYNNLYVLDENLKVVGSLEKLAAGEKIYSVRFMQNRAYMVTFKQTDPLFVIDLSNPQTPKVLGELKMPGFSNYLHPYDETTLIGIGKDASETEAGWAATKGLKISLFDVADVANPKEIDSYLMGDRGSDSIALSDHKAFLFSKEKSLLVIPVSIRESISPNEWGKLTFSGAAIFTVDKSGIKLKGKIDHSDNGAPSSQDYWGGYDYYDNTVKRSLYISDTLYTFSNFYLKANKLEDLSLIKNLPLEKERSGVTSDYNVVN